MDLIFRFLVLFKSFAITLAPPFSVYPFFSLPPNVASWKCLEGELPRNHMWIPGFPKSKRSESKFQITQKSPTSRNLTATRRLLAIFFVSASFETGRFSDILSYFLEFSCFAPNQTIFRLKLKFSIVRSCAVGLGVQFVTLEHELITHCWRDDGGMLAAT